MSFIQQTDSVTRRTWTLVGNDLAFGDASTPEVPPETLPERIEKIAAAAPRRFFPTMTAAQVKNRAPDGGWFVGPGGRTRQHMRRVANELHAEGWRATVSGKDDGTSLLHVMPPTE